MTIKIDDAQLTPEINGCAVAVDGALAMNPWACESSWLLERGCAGVLSAFVNAEYAAVLGPRPAARLVDRHLKLLALLGGRVTVGTAVLADSHSMQCLVADRGIREFVADFDQGFLRLESPGPGLRVAGGRERVERDAWARMLVPGWVSSSGLGTPAMVASAAAALDAGSGDAAGRKQFEAALRRIAAQCDLDQHARARLLCTFAMLDWFATLRAGSAQTRIPAAHQAPSGACDLRAIPVLRSPGPAI
jgi:hypothetical protein